MDRDKSGRMRTAYQTAERNGSTRTSSDDTSPIRDARQLKPTKRKPLSLRSEPSSKLTSQRPTSSTPRPRQHSSASSPLTSPEFTHFFPTVPPETPSRAPTRNSNETFVSRTYTDDRSRNFSRPQDEHGTRSLRPSQESARSPKTSIESSGHAPRQSSERAHSDKKAKRRSITVIPENKSDWDVRISSPSHARSRRKSDKTKPTTSFQDGVVGGSETHLPRSSDEGTKLRPDGSRPTPVVDPRQMLQLMRTTRGRMQGLLYFRQVIAQPWEEGHCFIDVESGSLCSEDDIQRQTFCLLQDLRKCKVKAVLHSDLGAVVLHITTMVGQERLQIRPVSTQYLNAWFAAMLCWSSVQLGQHLTDRREQQRPNLIRQISNYLPVVDQGSIAIPITKAGSATLIEVEEPKEAGEPSVASRRSRTTWSTVSCLLNAKGELRILSKDLHFLVTVHLAELPRSAIQRLGLTVFGADCIIAIYPQYAQSTTACSRLRPIYLSYESRELYEVWFVLMRAHAVPELYGTNRMQAAGVPQTAELLPGIESPSSPMYFRLERSLHIKLNEARLDSGLTQETEMINGYAKDIKFDQRKPSMPANYCVEILLDGQVKAKSTVRYQTMEPVWYDQSDFHDFATALSTITIRLKRQSLQSTTDDRIKTPTASVPGMTSSKYASRNASSTQTIAQPSNPFEVVGEAVVETSMLSSGVDVESWYAMSDDVGNPVGEVSLKIRHEEDTVLMDREYDAISDLLHNFSNSLTLQIYERIPLELARLSVCLLDIFQVSGQATDWLMALAEEEVDGVREQAISRTRFTHRLDSRESHESLATAVAHNSNREDIVRELNKSARQEANLLFRGNTLLSKALDYHMRRVGHSYLNDTIGPTLRQIASENLECEVDPSKTPVGYDLQRAWKRLRNTTATLWERIRKSANQCPAELRTVFRHIRACADDRYGDYMRTVTYSSVSGFLFLRFFCAAVLNPYLFGLLKDSAPVHAQRTYILIAKSLNGLASMTTFGNKEPWMAPMNPFLSQNRQAFKRFIDDVCSIRTDEPASPMPTSYAAPFMIFQKLPLASREGFPSLPYLIDRARSLATLVDIWLEGLKDIQRGSTGISNGARLSNSLTGDLARFHDACLSLRQRTRAAWHTADRSERTPSGLAHKWVATAERMEVVPEEFWGLDEPPALDSLNNASPHSAAASVHSERSFGERKKRLSMKSPSRRKSKHRHEQNAEVTNVLVPPRRPSSTSGYRPTSSSRPRTASQPLVRPVATAAQLTGSVYMSNAGLAFSSTATSENEAGNESDEDGRHLVIRTMRDLSGDNLPVIGRNGSQVRNGAKGRGEERDGKAARELRMDNTLTAESLHGREMKLGVDEVEKERKERRGFWRRKDKEKNKREDDDRRGRAFRDFEEPEVKYGIDQPIVPWP